jgi:hypothetical protein
MINIRPFPRRFVKALVAVTVLGAVALPAAIAGSAGATQAPPSLTCVSLTTCSTFATAQIGDGYSGVLNVTGTDLADNGSTVTITSSAPGVTFSQSSESSASEATTVISVPATTPSGWYSVTLSDGTNPELVLADAFYVNPAPTITSISPATVLNTGTADVTITGSNFVTGATLSFASAVDGTPLVVAAVNVVSPTQITATVTAENSVTSNPATVGTYAATVTNADGGTIRAAADFTVDAAPSHSLTSVSPSIIAVPTSGSTTTTATLTGTGFVAGATATVSGVTGVTADTVVVTSATSASVNITVPSTAIAGQLQVTLTNPDTTSGTLVDAIGIGEPSAATGNAPTVTAVSSLPVLSAGATGTLAITGTGFSTYSTVSVFSGATGSTPSGVTCAATYVSATSLSCVVGGITAATLAGPDSIVVNAGDGVTNSSANFANAVTIAGPVITSGSPSTLPTGGSSVLTLTGTGFAAGDTPTVTGATYTANSIVVVSATEVTIAVTNATGPNVTVQLTSASATSPIATVATVVANPVVTGIAYVSGTTNVGVGALNQPLTIDGTGFLPGATLTFAAVSGVTAVVSAVSPTQIIATVSVPATTVPGSFTYTVTNPNGGATTNAALPLTVIAAPTVTFSPASRRASSTGVVTIIGGPFLVGAKVTTTAATSLVTLGATTFVSATEITVPVTVSAIAGTTSVSIGLTVVNTNGAQVTTPFIINTTATVTGTYYVAPSSTNREITVTGSGFSTSGVTVASSNPAYSLSVVSSTAASVTFLVTTTAAAKAGTSSLVTITNSDGSAVSFTLNGGTGPKVPALRALGFTAKSSALSTHSRVTLRALVRLLKTGAHLTVHATASTSRLALARAQATEKFLRLFGLSLKFTTTVSTSHTSNRFTVVTNSL